jgi:hypothetical protein
MMFLIFKLHHWITIVKNNFKIISLINITDTFLKSMIFDEELRIIVLYCIEGMVIPAQCTATFSDLLCSPEFGY